MRRLAGQNKTGIARRLFKRFEQGIGGNGIHALGRINQHGLSQIAATGALDKFDGSAHGLDADFFAGLAFFVADFFLRFFVQRPALFQRLHFGHQYVQVSMGAGADRMAARAAATGQAMGLRLLAQPGLHQRHAQCLLPQARRALQQPGVATLLQQSNGLLLDPGRQHLCGIGRCTHNHPLARTASSTCWRTASTDCAASIRTKRCGFSAARRA